MDYCWKEKLKQIREPMKILIATGSRAEFGLMLPLLREIERDNFFQLFFVVTGSHLEAEFGKTVWEIESSGIEIFAKVFLDQSNEQKGSIGRSVSRGIDGFTDIFEKTDIDICMIMGDRYEILSVAVAAFFSNVLVAHLSGGELTQGSKDDAIRHAITKLSSLHFVTAEVHQNRVIQLGAPPKMVINVGEPGLDSLIQEKTMTRKMLQGTLNFILPKIYFLMTYHPPTSISETEMQKELTTILDSLALRKECFVVCTLPNPDQSWSVVKKQLLNFESKNKSWFKTVQSLGRQRYVAMVKYAKCVIGNSSSGLIEVPMIGTPTVNIGIRQQGRLAGRSVISVIASAENINRAIDLCLSDDFIKKNIDLTSPYGDGKSSRRIINELKNIDLTAVRNQNFHDINQV